jgi:ATP-dependent Clp protease protease subunit
MPKNRMYNSIPYVIEKDGDSERAYDIYSRLLENRIILIGEEITTQLANSIIAQLLLLDERDSSRDICLYINSPGGEITAGLAIYDTLNYIKSDVRTVVIGMACSMAAVLASSGTRGKRNALPNTYIMIHQPRQEGNRRMTVTEQEIDLKVIKKMKTQLTTILAENTNKTYKQIYKDCEMDKWFSSEEALEYGLVDEIIYNKKV